MSGVDKKSFAEANRGRLKLSILVLLIVLGAALRIANLGGVINRTPDERIYTWEGDEIVDHGQQGFSSLVAQFQKDPSLFVWPSPARVGYLGVLSWTIRISGHRDASAGAILSCIASIGSSILLGMIGWRWFSPLATLSAMLFYAVSPPVLTMARRSWEESLVEALALLLLFVALKAVQERTSWWWVVAAAVIASFSIAIKELAVVHAALVIALLGIALIRQGEWQRFGLLALSGSIAIILCCSWIAHVLGGFSVFIDFTSRGVALSGSTPYAIAWESGSLFKWIILLWECDPVIFTLGIVGIVNVIWLSFRLKCSAEVYAQIWSCIIVFVFLVLPLPGPNHLNVRFMCPIFAPLCLLTGVGVRVIAEALRRSFHGSEREWTMRFASGVLMFAAFINYRAFQEKFVRTDLQDLSFKMIQGNSD